MLIRLNGFPLKTCGNDREGGPFKFVILGLACPPSFWRDPGIQVLPTKYETLQLRLPKTKNPILCKAWKERLCNSSKGFSLLELIVALFIVSLVLALVMPSFGVFGDNKLKSEAREMASVLRYLNDSASSRKETYALKFDLDKNIVSWKDPEGEKERVVDDLSGVTTQSNGRVSRGELTVFFEPLGIRQNLIVHMSRDNHSMSVTLNHLSGKVKIKDETKQG